MESRKKEVRTATVMTPEPALRRPMILTRNMLRDLANSRELGLRLFYRDLKGLYRNSLLGYLWIFLPPLATTLAFIYLNKQQVIRVEELPISYPAYAMLGTLLWQNFADALQAPLRMVGQNRAMLIRVNFPREALILSGIYSVVFNFSARLILVIPVIIYYQIPIGTSLLCFPLGVLALVVFGTALGVLLTPLGILYKDVEMGTTMALGFWMLLTPVVYAPMSNGLGAVISKFNPVTPLLQTSRDWLVGQPPSQLPEFYWISGLTVGVLVFGWILYRLSLPHVIARIGN
jgi:lipopolysaccharide transport system permease protein